MGDGPFFTEILRTLIKFNISGNIGNKLNLVVREQGFQLLNILFRRLL